MLAGFALVLAALAQTPSGDLEAALALFDRLDNVVITTEYDGVPLSKTLTEMAARVPVPLRVDWPALDRLGVDDDDEITLRINQSNGNSALAALAFCLGDEMERPVFEAHGGQMVLTTIEGSAAMRLTAAYDVRDLLANPALVQRLQEQRPQPAVGPEQPARDADHPGAEDDAGDGERAPAGLPPVRPIPQPLGPPPGHDPEHPELARPDTDAIDAPPAREPTPGEQLLWIITDHVDPDAWMNYGGNRALITELDGVLMVTAPPRTHRLLRDALKQLRQANPAMLAIEATIVDVPRATHARLSRQNDPMSAAFALALRNEKDAIMVWRADQALAIGGELAVQVRNGGIEVRIALKPQFDSARGVLLMELDASTNAGEDHRQVKTTLAMNPAQVCATVELPNAKPSETMRLIVLSVARQ